MPAKTMKVKKVASVKKKEAKKSAKVVSVKKGNKKEPLVAVSGEMCFWVNNGPSLCSMKDLGDALRTMSHEQFAHHTGMGRNDFSIWIESTLGDKKCASDFIKAKNMKGALAVVEKHLKRYSA